MNRPNIIYLHTHDTGRMVSPYGHAVPTPRLQQLAEESVLFRQAFSAAPTCSPSRAGLLTGQAPHSAGMLGLAHMGWSLKDYRQHLVHPLHEAGYRSAMVGVQHVAPGPDEGDVIGYHEHLRTSGRLAHHIADAAVDFLGGTHEQPFFLSVGFVETHILPTDGATFGYPARDDRYVAPPPPLPDTPQVRADVASFHAAAEAFDTALGRVLDALDAHGLRESTIVLVTTDHGVALPGMKATLTDLGTGVMMLLQGPGLPPGRVCDALVSQIDVVPTLCELIGIDVPPWVQGRSVLPALRDGAEVNEAVFAEMTYHVAYEPARSARTRRWRYTRRFGERRSPVLPNTDDSPSKDVWVEAGWRDRTVAEEELFDLVLDPGERRNLAQDPALHDVLSQMRALLDDWMQRTDDPILSGPIAQPAGFPYVHADRTSPEEVDA